MLDFQQYKSMTTSSNKDKGEEKKFRVGLNGIYFEILVYSNLNALYKEANRWAKSTKREESDLTDSLALVQPFEKFIVLKDGKEKTYPEVGKVRFSKSNISPHIVSHEVVHMAMWFFRLSNDNGKADFGNENSQSEEDFADIYCRLFRKMSIKLYQYGFWK